MKKTVNRFNIDFLEFSFLVEACIPPCPIARTTFWYDVIDKYYHVLTPEERANLYEWIGREQSFKRGIEESNEDCLLFAARYNPDNQYKVTAEWQDEVYIHECFLFQDKYHTLRNTHIGAMFIKKVEKL